MVASVLSAADIGKTTALLAQWGEPFTYASGGQSYTLRAYASEQVSQFQDSNGVVVEVRSTDFVCLTSALTLGDPIKGDSIIAADGTKYQVQPTSGEKCFRRRVPTTTRIHAKKVSQ